MFPTLKLQTAIPTRGGRQMNDADTKEIKNAISDSKEAINEWTREEITQCYLRLLEQIYDFEFNVMFYFLLLQAQIIFAALKLEGIIDWSWLWLGLPITAGVTIAILASLRPRRSPKTTST